MRCLILAGIAFLCLSFLQTSAVSATVIRFDTNLGSFDVSLYDTEVPGTVDNFLKYVNDESLNGTIVHRKVSDFVIQGGGFNTTGRAITTNPPIPLEAIRSNVRGTIAMARTSVRDSATSQWFINLVDNTFLDTAGGGYAVFGEVVGDGMTVVDRIGQLSTVRRASPFGELPLLDVSQPISAENLVVVQKISVIPEPAAASFGLLALAALRRRRRLVG